MNGVVAFTGFDFHDSSLTAIECRGGAVVLSLEDVWRNDCRFCLEVAVHGVTSVRDDAGRPSRIAMQTDDGAVLRLAFQDDGSLILVVDWVRYSPRSTLTCVYVLGGAGLRVSVMGIRQMPD